jgi:hypothetical protein
LSIVDHLPRDSQLSTRWAPTDILRLCRVGYHIAPNRVMYMTLACILAVWS